MKVEDIKNCDFSFWYPLFKNATLKSIVLNIPDFFLTYLNKDGIVLPESVSGSSGKDSDDSDADWDSLCPSSQIPDFGDFDTEMRIAIKNLGGTIFPKLNWSSPKDAVWISHDSSLRCSCPADICLLLKSSDFIAHDLTEPYDSCEDVNCEADIPQTKYKLVLRRWKELHPAGEFRCFVKNRQLVGISQRHASNFYPFISNDEESIVEDIKQLFNSTVKETFPSSSYVFDVYRREKGKLQLIDFNPFGSVTDGLLFTWEELFNMEVDSNTCVNPVFRFIQAEAGVQPNPYSCYTMPVDFVHLSTGQDPHKLMDFINLKIQSQNEDSASDDETKAAEPEAATEAVNTHDQQTDSDPSRQEIT